jgi:hypothetical protein
MYSDCMKLTVCQTGRGTLLPTAIMHAVAAKTRGALQPRS